jgi:hypothetical protein
LESSAHFLTKTFSFLGCSLGPVLAYRGFVSPFKKKSNKKQEKRGTVQTDNM